MTSEPVQIERHVAAPPHIVYRYLTETSLRDRWLGLSSELEPGGAFEMTSPNGMTASGQVVEAAPSCLAFTWGWEGHPDVPPGSTLVRIELVPDGDGTLLRLTHSGLADSERDMHAAGWRHYLDRLAVAATGGDPGPDPGAG